MLKFFMQVRISQELIDLQRSFYACSNTSYIVNNNFNLQCHEKQALTQKSDRERINCDFSMGMYEIREFGPTRYKKS